MSRFFFIGLSFSLTFGFACGSATASDLVFANNSKIETNFYFISTETVQMADDHLGPDKTRLLSANEGNTVYWADKVQNRINVSRIIQAESLASVENIESIELPSLPDLTHPDNLILDLHVKNHHLYVARGVGSYSINSCGHVEILDYMIKSADALVFQGIIFSSTPCVYGDTSGNGWTAKLASDNLGNLYLAGGNWLVDYKVGTFPFSGFLSLKGLSNIPKTNFYGSVVRLDLQSKKIFKVAKGLRNLGGLFWDPKRNILFNTDNGTRGGDRLNIVSPNKDFGWPNVSLGLPYAPDRKIGAKVNTYLGFSPPLFSWTPSISPSQIQRVVGKEFGDYWSGDLLVGSLKDESIHRLRLSSDSKNVVYDERIKVNERIRSMSILPGGKILISTDSGKFMLIRLFSKAVSGLTPPQP